jgi:MFS transporter, ACS family, glucarate transporter
MLLSYRMLVGVYIGQYCINTLTWFFLTWFPLYLSQARHMSVVNVGLAAAVPGLCGGVGGILGGVISDRLLSSRPLAHLQPQASHHGRPGAFDDHHRLQLRVLADLMLFFMSLSFFGKGVGALGWTVISDTSPGAWWA